MFWKGAQTSAMMYSCSGTSTPQRFRSEIPDIERMSRVSWRSVVTADRWKLNLSPGDQCELYDLNADPFELSNRFDDPQCRDRIRDMTARIRIWQDAVADNLTLPPV